MIRILKTLAIAGILNFTTISYAQVNNSGFEQNQGDRGTHCPNNSGDLSFAPFNKGKVSFWNASHGSPQLHTKENVSGCDGAINDAKEGYWCAYLSYAAENCEGIFQNLKLDKNEIINLAISAKGYSSNSKLVIKLKNGLSNESTGNTFPASSLSNLINPSNEQLLLNQTLTTDWETYYITNVSVEQDFSQIWIYSDGNSIKIDQFFVNISCCKLREEYQNIVNPPSTYRNDYIKAGELIDINRTQGKVIIDNQNTTVFQAKNKVLLEPGFEVKNDSKFIAQIDLCTNLSTSIEIEQRKNTCEHEYIARVCNGSGFYSFQWNLNGMEAIGGTTDYRVKFKPKSGQTVMLTVTDLADNSQITSTVNLGYVPFTGNFPNDSFITGNAFSPNGDGIGEEWYIGDVAKPNISVYAYDAFEIELKIFNRYDALGDRHEGLVFGKKGENKTIGFPDKFVLWNGGSPPSTGTYYPITVFKNCYNTKVITQTIWLNANKPLPPPLNNDSQYLRDSESLRIGDKNTNTRFADLFISPNPASSYLRIENRSIPMGALNISISDPAGRIIMKEQLNSNTSDIQINISTLNSGLYFITFEHEGRIQISNFIKQ